MRIAYCFAGYLRTYDKNLTLFANMLNYYPGDVFVHTWDKLNYGHDDTWHRDTTKSNVRLGGGDVDWIYRHYKPIDLIIENDENFPYKNSYYSPMPMSKYSIYKSVELKRKYEMRMGFIYDWVFVMRFDLVLFNTFKLPADNSILYYLWNYRAVDNKAHLMDILNFSCSKNIDLLADLYPYILSKEEDKLKHSPEEFLYEWISQHPIKTQSVKYDMALLRLNGELFHI